MATIDYNTRQKIIAQVLGEIRFARNYKQGKARNWKLNEDLYYARKNSPEASRSNVDLGQMQAFVHSILAKVDNPLIFKFVKRKEAQIQRVAKLNALRIFDQDRDDWDMKDIVGKKQAIIYGRATYSYFADSSEGYTPHLNNVDVYDFLIDPAAGGLDIERAMYLGDYGVVYTKSQLKAGIKSKEFLKTETEELISGGSNATEMPQEEVNKINRTRDQNVWQVNKELSGSEKYKFWRWGTTFEGKRYYVLINERGGTAIKIKPIEEVVKNRLWWYWTYAAFPDLTEYWTPGFCDYARELFMAQAVSINQMIDNAEQINKPQKIVNVGAVDNLSEVKYRREGIIKVGKDFDTTKAVTIIPTPSINTPIEVFNLLETIQEKASGVTAAQQGAADNNSDSKVAIYEGNQANSADRFGYFNKSYAHGYKKFAKLWESGVDEHLIKKVAIDIMGPDGVQVIDVSRRDIFRKGESFGLIVESSNAELQLSASDKDAKIAFLEKQAQVQTPIQNNKKAYEMQATIVGFSEEEIRELLDTSDFGDSSLMAQAERDIEDILDGKRLKPYTGATTAYKQRIVDYITKNQYELDTVDFTNLWRYVKSLQPVIVANMVKMGNAVLMQNALKQAMAPQVPSSNPPVPPIEPGADGATMMSAAPSGQT